MSIVQQEGREMKIGTDAQREIKEAIDQFPPTFELRGVNGTFRISPIYSYFNDQDVCGTNQSGKGLARVDNVPPNVGDRAR